MVSFTFFYFYSNSPWHCDAVYWFGFKKSSFRVRESAFPKNAHTFWFIFKFLIYATMIFSKFFLGPPLWPHHFFTHLLSLFPSTWLYCCKLMVRSSCCILYPQASRSLTILSLSHSRVSASIIDVCCVHQSCPMPQVKSAFVTDRRPLSVLTLNHQRTMVAST